MASILNNVSALGASRQIGITGSGLQRTIERLTTGRRINRASDDAAGLGISNKLGADIRIASQGKRNANDGISYLQVADGVLDEVTNLLTRAAELAQQAQTGTISDTNRASIDAEFQNILSTMIDIGQTTKFNGAAVFSSATVSVSVGGYSGISITVGAISSPTSVLGLSQTSSTTTATVPGAPPAGWVSDGAGGYRPSGVDFFNNQGSGVWRAWKDIDGDPNTLGWDYPQNWAPAGWTPVDTGMGGPSPFDFNVPAGWTTTGTGGIWGANAYSGYDTISGFLPPPTTTTTTTPGGSNMATAASASTAATAIAAALDSVSSVRASLGASMQRLNAVSNALGIQVENFTAAYSQIRDANIAEEVVNLTKFQILNQSGTSVVVSK